MSDGKSTYPLPAVRVSVTYNATLAGTPEVAEVEWCKTPPHGDLLAVLRLLRQHPARDKG